MNSADLTRAALRILGALPTGTDVSAEDAEIVGAAITAMMARLASHGIYGAPEADIDNIADDAFFPLANLLAQECAAMYGATFDADAVKYWEAQLIKTRIALSYSYPVRVEYF